MKFGIVFLACFAATFAALPSLAEDATMVRPSVALAQDSMVSQTSNDFATGLKWEWDSAPQ
jgi:hypothetical protein